MSAEKVLIDRIKWISEHMEEPKLLVKGEEFEIVKDAVLKAEQYETQYLDDMGNLFEPIKISSALRSEVMKLNFRKEHRPKDISILDYVIIACLKKVLEEVSE